MQQPREPTYRDDARSRRKNSWVWCQKRGQRAEAEMAAAVARGVARVARPALARAATLAPVARLPAVAPRCVSRFSTGTDSHDDFKPKVKAVATDEVQELIAKAVEASPVMLFMKGTPMQVR